MDLVEENKLKSKDSLSGFDKIASQIYNRSIIQGFKLNILLVGIKGSGKTTFLNNLFHTNVLEKSSDDTDSKERSFLLIENNVKLQVKVIEIREFENDIKKNSHWKGIGNYLDKCFQKQLEHEQKIDRSIGLLQDHLIHLCLYFVQPRGKSFCLRNQDIEFLKSVHKKVNIVPLIAKSDSLTPHEIELHKKNLQTELDNNAINYFKFIVPVDSGWMPDSTRTKQTERIFLQNLIARFPFAVAAGNETKRLKNKEELVRSYPWGSVQIDNLDHCDTLAVRTLILSTHLQELIDETRFTIYENYRVNFLNELCGQLDIPDDRTLHPSLYLERYFANEYLEFIKTMKDLENRFQDSQGKKQEAFQRKSKDIEFESLKMSQELQYLYSAYDKDLAYFIAERTRWNCENMEYQEACGTLKISKYGLINGMNKFKK